MAKCFRFYISRQTDTPDKHIARPKLRLFMQAVSKNTVEYCQIQSTYIHKDDRTISLRKTRIHLEQYSLLQ